MLTVDLKKEHKLFDESNDAGSINYQGAGMAFLKKDYSEKLAYCEDLDRDEAQAFFDQQEEYFFGECNLDWEFVQKPSMGRGKVSMFFAKYYKNGYFDQPFDQKVVYMKKIGLGLDYNNICKDYNTVYLDRDNNDMETVACMKKVLQWFNEFFSDFLETFEYDLYRMNSSETVVLSELVKKRFFFYSLEKEIMAQTFLLQKEKKAYDNLDEWSRNADESLMVKNDDEGEGVYFYFNENSEIHKWLLAKLSDCSLDDIPFEEAQILANRQELYKENLTNAIKELDSLALYKLDSDSKLLKLAFNILYKNEVFNLYDIPLTEHNDYKFILFSHLTKVSGSLAFLGIQILAANVIMIMNNFPKKDEYFKKQCGIAINHLRAPVTVVSAIKCDGGYKLNGRLTWASGYGIFDTLLIGFHYDGREYEAMASFVNFKSFLVGEVTTSFVGRSMATVNIELNDFFVKDEDVVSSQMMGSYTKKKSVSKTVHFALYGLGIGVVEILTDEEVKAFTSIKLESIKEKFLATSDGEEMDKLRIELFIHVQETITIGMVLYGGKSILIEEKLQRYYRELIMFNSNGLNSEIKSLFKEKFLTKKINTF